MAVQKDPRVDAYIDNAAPFAQPILKHLRKLVHSSCPDAVETIKWSCPFFTYQGKLLCNFAAFKEHASFGFWHQELETLLTKELDKTEDGMGLLGRIRSKKDLPSDADLARYLKKAVELHNAGGPAREKSKPRPAPPTPVDLTAGLKRNKKASLYWETLSPSGRREYIEWITEAKRPETREQRLETTLEWLAEGKPRNWKYKNC